MRSDCATASRTIGARYCPVCGKVMYVATLRTLKISSELLNQVMCGQAIMLADGGMGSLIQQAGLSQVHDVPDLLNLTHASDICTLQRGYVEAGSDCIATNTFNSNRLKLANHDASVDELYAAAVRIARDAGAPLVAGDIGPTGSLLAPLGELGFEEAYDIFSEQARAACAAGCDLIFLETFADLLEAKAALLACLDNTPLPVFVTMTFGENGRTFMGTTPAVAASTLSSLGASAVGINCSLGPAEITPLVTQMAPHARCPLMAQPNAGLPRIAKDGSTVYDVDPARFAQAMVGILEAGARIVGGCCGTTPAHIAALRQLIDDGNWLHDGVSDYRPSFVVTSAQELVELMPGAPTIATIGERINPTGKPRLKEALASGSYDIAISEAVAQIEAGADILDVNVGVPGIDEPRTLHELTERLQATVSAPLQLDSANSSALETACRSYAGRPLINSVNGKAESLASVLPIAARYGATIVGLTLDEDGIPPSAEGRLAIAERIIDAALSAGLHLEDIAIDCLVMAAATNQPEVPEILEAVRLCKERLGVRTVLGVSNVSFGLPARPILNASFLTAALACGLDLPIINPLEPRYREAIAAFRIINGQDAGCLEYVHAMQNAAISSEANVPPVISSGESEEGAPPVISSGESEASEVEKPRPSHSNVSDGRDFSATPPDGGSGRNDSGPASALHDAILTGQRDAAAKAARIMLATSDVASIAGDVLAPALDEVGLRYDEGTYFLPQLMAAAEAAKSAFDVLNEASTSIGVEQSNPLPIILATVEGDIHDIGKNIVKMLLENYGYTVIDLGRDIAPQTIVSAVLDANAPLVGLSALMTTTLPAMERTIALLREQAPETRIMVGGAVLAKDYAQRIGADYYADDAAASVRIAQQVLGE